MLLMFLDTVNRIRACCAKCFSRSLNCLLNLCVKMLRMLLCLVFVINTTKQFKKKLFFATINIKPYPISDAKIPQLLNSEIYGTKIDPIVMYG